MGKNEVTQAQWRAVARLRKVGMDLNPEPSFFKGDDLPVEQVNWDDAVEFCLRLSQATGKAYRLPTEAEWEYACRANTRGDYAGDLDEMAWYSDNSAKTTHPVRRKKPNGFGLYDMHGNVWEWCRDWYSEDYYSQSAIEDPRGPNNGSFRVLRGGSWVDLASGCRSAYRSRYTPDNLRGSRIGFRVVTRTP
jgi:formylglycine-generating enzyme required for sulfatase activity